MNTQKPNEKVRNAGRIGRAIRELQQITVARRPAFSPGILTSETTAGVIREAQRRVGAGDGEDNVPRWA